MGKLKIKSPKDKYKNDSHYKVAVDMMKKLIYDGKFTPFEIRKMTILASIHYELRYGFKQYTVPLEVNESFNILSEWRNKEQ